MVKKIFLIIFVLFLGIIQHTFFSHLAIKNTYPNFVILFFFLISFFDKKIATSFFIYPFAFFGGIILDLFSPFFFGLYSTIMLFLAGVIKYLLQIIIKRNFVTFFVSLFFVLFFAELLQTFVFGLLARNYLSLNVWAIIYNSFLGIGFYFFYVFFKKIFPG
ncbi:MAG: hypothetical protein LR000_00670 [Candidatus Pacebacteria bacterium]|nr:hypothetical protein [Candidatus Paceibacterota bacterium]